LDKKENVAFALISVLPSSVVMKVSRDDGHTLRTMMVITLNLQKDICLYDMQKIQWSFLETNGEKGLTFAEFFLLQSQESFSCITSS
jgi:hypothetical protein